MCEKDYVWNLSTYNCENGKYLASIMDDSVIMWNDIIESQNEETNFSEERITRLVIFLITIALLIAVSIYYYLIKY